MARWYGRRNKTNIHMGSIYNLEKSVREFERPLLNEIISQICEREMNFAFEIGVSHLAEVDSKKESYRILKPEISRIKLGSSAHVPNLLQWKVGLFRPQISSSTGLKVPLFSFHCQSLLLIRSHSDVFQLY
jgi:hypothetical protein